MIQVKALNEETNKVLDFYVSNTLPDLSLFIECLNYIRYGWSRNWRCVDHTHVSTSEDSQPPRYEMKYIIFEDESDKEHILVFDKSINHDYMALAFGHMSDEYYKPVSAGFTNGISCYGESETLRIASRETDTGLVYV